MKTVKYRLCEFFIIFIVVPVSFVLPYAGWIKMLLGTFGFAYIIFILLRVEKSKFNLANEIEWASFWKSTVSKLIGIILLTTLYVWNFDKLNLFQVVVQKPLMWLIILFVYSCFSVYPQELIYRTFFFERYKELFKNETLFLFVNAIVFSLAHLFFRNMLVIILTFLGGLLFAVTYKKTKSTIMVSIEHAIYGCWLFTVGMGNMLGFPS